MFSISGQWFCNISCTSSISQYSAIQVFDNDIEIWVNENRKDLIKKRDYIINKFQKNKINFLKPNASFYIFVCLENYVGKEGINKNIIHNSEEFCEYLLNYYNIACAPGSAFGIENYMRICYSTNFDILKNAIENIINCINLLKIKK